MANYTKLSAKEKCHVFDVSIMEHKSDAFWASKSHVILHSKKSKYKV